MSVLQVRGGLPQVVRTTATTTGRKHRLSFYTSGLVARNQGANVVHLYFTEADFDASENYVVLPVAAATDPHGEWSGPVEVENVWLRSVGGDSITEVVVFQRRG